MTTEPLSLRGYARHRGVSLRAVQKAVASGRIKTLEDGRIDPQAADEQWTRNTAPRPQRPTEAANPPLTRNTHHRSELPKPNSIREESREPSRLDSAFDFARARAVRENYEARLRKLEFEERSGRLVNRDEIEVAAFNRFRMYRDAMLNIPDRLSAQLAAETDPARVHELLTEEIRRALNEVSDAFRG